jgi:DNA-binding response OmpR family regulator
VSTILIVDDSPVMQRLLCLTLQRDGHDVSTVSNGREALSLLSDVRFDLAIVDLAMPEMDGIALVRQIRSNQRCPHLPVIMLTASGQDADRVLAGEAGADDFLTKPANSRVLIETVHRLIDAS